MNKFTEFDGLKREIAELKKELSAVKDTKNHYKRKAKKYYDVLVKVNGDTMRIIHD